MAAAFDSFSSANSGGFTASPFTWNSAPVGTPRGVLVWIVEAAQTALNAGACTYGGVAMTKVAEPLNVAGEFGVVYAFFLGSGVPTGVQAINFTHTGTASKYGGCILLTADDDVELIDFETIISDALANPSATLSLGGRTCFAGIGFFSGQAAITGVTPLSGWTDRGEHDFGSNVGAVYSYDTVGAADVTAGWTQTSDDAVAVAIAVSEVTGGGGGGSTQPPMIHFIGV